MKEFISKRLRVWENINRTMQEFKVLLLGYRNYTALLTQTGTDAPVATVLENTLGNITWEYDGVGNYLATSDKLFNNIFYASAMSDYNLSDNITAIYFGKVDENLFNLIALRNDPNGLNFGDTTNNWTAYIEIRVYN